MAWHQAKRTTPWSGPHSIVQQSIRAGGVSSAWGGWRAWISIAATESSDLLPKYVGGIEEEYYFYTPCPPPSSFRLSPLTIDYLFELALVLDGSVRNVVVLTMTINNILILLIPADNVFS